LTGVQVTIAITQSLVGGPVTSCPAGAESGFAFQLNALSPTSTASFEWQQYIFGIDGAGTTIGGAVNNWTAAALAPNSSTPFWQTPEIPVAPLTTGLTIPAGYTLTFTLGYSGSSVNQVTYTVNDGNGNQYSPPPQVFTSDGIPAPATPGELAPISAFQLDIVGPGNLCHTNFLSGAGTITYSTTQTNLTTGNANPPTQCMGGVVRAATGESSNAVYESPESIYYNTVTQSFSIPNPWTEVLSGCASNIAAADGNYPWITGCAATGSRNNIYYWGGGSWVGPTSGAAENIAAFNAAGENYPVVVGTNGKVYFGQPQGSDIGSNAGASVQWFENTNGLVSGTSVSTYSVDNGQSFINYVSGTNDVLYSATNYNAWSTIGSPDGIATWISVAPDDSSLIALNGSGAWYRWSGVLDPGPSSGDWISEGGNVNQVAAGPGAVAYISNGVLWWEFGTNSPQILSSGAAGQPSWANLPVAGDPGAWGTLLSVGANGVIWVIDGDGAVWYFGNVPASVE
jgi:hypothetical protein